MKYVYINYVADVSMLPKWVNVDKIYQLTKSDFDPFIIVYIPFDTSHIDVQNDCENKSNNYQFRIVSFWFFFLFSTDIMKNVHLCFHTFFCGKKHPYKKFHHDVIPSESRSNNRIKGTIECSKKILSTKFNG